MRCTLAILSICLLLNGAQIERQALIPLQIDNMNEYVIGVWNGKFFKGLFFNAALHFGKNSLFVLPSRRLTVCLSAILFSLPFYLCFVLFDEFQWECNAIDRSVVSLLFLFQFISFVQSLGLLGSAPAALLILSLFGLLLYLLTRCCDRKPRTARSITSFKVTLAVVTVLCCGAIGLGKFLLYTFFSTPIFPVFWHNRICIVSLPTVPTLLPLPISAVTSLPLKRVVSLANFHFHIMTIKC